MGLLKVLGRPLTFEESKKYLAYVREHGVTQFLSTWNRVKDISNDELRWGDEIECGILLCDPVNKTLKISVRGKELLELLNSKEESVAHQSEGCVWHPEYGNWMIESTPSRPYTNYATDMLRVERNMRLRRKRLVSSLGPNEIAPTTTSFPLLGVGEFYELHNKEVYTEAQLTTNPSSKSLYLPDVAINPHPRFACLTANIRERRGEKVNIQVPLYKDIQTPEYALHTQGMPTPTIDMDCMGFGMGMCCLQVTFQACDCDESRYMYDQLAVLAPIMLALTAASPIYKGKLADIDTRWTVIAQSVDDRTKAERGLVEGSADLEKVRDSRLAGDGIKSLPKSRYDSVSTYIYHCQDDTICARTFAEYNDIKCPIDEDVKKRLRDNNVDENLAHHIAHLFTRDPLVVFDGNVEMDDEKNTDHFENIQSTNWQTCRWKPPPPRDDDSSPHIGWRTEFRSMEVSLTDFENAAFAVFIVLITRVLLSFDLRLYIPLSKVDENMQRAHSVDAINTEKFFFRRFVAPLDFADGNTSHPAPGASSASSTTTPSPCGSHQHGKTGLSVEDSFEEMTMNEIFHGKDAYFPGLIPLVYTYLDYINCDGETLGRVSQYLNLISRRAKGELPTTAVWMRNFVKTHPGYKNDSVVSQDILYDLMMQCKDIGEGNIQSEELMGNVTIDKILGGVDPYGTQLRGKLSIQERDLLLRNLLQRAVNMNASAPTPWGSTRSEKIRVRSDSYMCCQQEGCSSEEDCMGRAGAGTF